MLKLDNTYLVFILQEKELQILNFKFIVKDNHYYHLLNNPAC